MGEWKKILDSKEFYDEVFNLIVYAKENIEEDESCEQDDNDDPDIENANYNTITVGMDKDGNWGWQSGDNSYSGGAYGYRHWGVADYITKDSDINEHVQNIIGQLEDCLSQDDSITDNLHDNHADVNVQKES